MPSTQTVSGRMRTRSRCRRTRHFSNDLASKSYSWATIMTRPCPKWTRKWTGKTWRAWCKWLLAVKQNKRRKQIRCPCNKTSRHLKRIRTRRRSVVQRVPLLKHTLKWFKATQPPLSRDLMTKIIWLNCKRYKVNSRWVRAEMERWIHRASTRATPARSPTTTQEATNSTATQTACSSLITEGVLKTSLSRRFCRTTS